MSATATTANGEKKTVLVVDDAPANIHVVNEILRDTYKIRIATSGAKGSGTGRRDAGAGFDPAGRNHAGNGRLRSVHAAEGERRDARYSGDLSDGPNGNQRRDQGLRCGSGGLHPQAVLSRSGGGKGADAPCAARHAGTTGAAAADDPARVGHRPGNTAIHPAAGTAGNRRAGHCGQLYSDDVGGRRLLRLCRDRRSYGGNSGSGRLGPWHAGGADCLDVEDRLLGASCPCGRSGQGCCRA